MHGKIALVCGASQGIGAAIAESFARSGARVILLARSLEKLEIVRANLQKDSNNLNHHLNIGVDLADHNELDKRLTALLREVGGIDILVCNAGGPAAGPLLSAPLSDFHKALESHLFANQLLAQKLIPEMKKKNFGRIINIISTSVKVPIANLGVSNTVRAAVASWSKTLANEVGEFGITVNNVLPGYTATERLEVLKKNASQRLQKSAEQIEADWLQSIPLKRFAEPSEIAFAVNFLASDKASYISGINLPVDGGRTGSL